MSDFGAWIWSGFWPNSIWSSQVAWYGQNLRYNGVLGPTPLPPGEWPGIPFGGHFWAGDFSEIAYQSGIAEALRIGSWVRFWGHFVSSICSILSILAALSDFSKIGNLVRTRNYLAI